VLNTSTRLYGRRANRKRGQAVVEFALVIPLFMLILSGIMDFGVGLFQRMTIINAAREGARAAVMVPKVTGTTTVSLIDVQNAAWGASTSAAAQGGVSITNSNVAITCLQTSVSITSPATISCDGATSQDSVRVSVSYTYHTFFPLLFGASFGLGATVQMVID
jgi:Flp pilus assembly protein TadG